MKHRAIELHDSRVLRIIEDGPTVVVEMSAYVHASYGRPGVDAGDGWFQDAKLVFEGAEIRERPTGDDLWITSGSLRVGSSTFENQIHIPFGSTESVELSVTGAEGTLRVRGTAAKLILVGLPGAVEAFEP